MFLHRFQEVSRKCLLRDVTETTLLIRTSLERKWVHQPGKIRSIPPRYRRIHRCSMTNSQPSKSEAMKSQSKESGITKTSVIRSRKRLMIHQEGRTMQSSDLRTSSHQVLLFHPDRQMETKRAFSMKFSQSHLPRRAKSFSMLIFRSLRQGKLLLILNFLFFFFP